MTKHAQGPVLVPIDFSPHSEEALAWAAEYGRLADVPLLVLHVVHDPESDPGYYRRAWEKARGPDDPMIRIDEIAAKLMGKFLHQVAARHPGLSDDLPTRLVTGVPATRIIEVAEEVDARHIVVGSHGRTRLSRMLLGSKAEQVLRLASIPVTIVKADRAFDAS